MYNTAAGISFWRLYAVSLLLAILEVPISCSTGKSVTAFQAALFRVESANRNRAEENQSKETGSQSPFRLQGCPN
jgi:hypothetical protein